MRAPVVLASIRIQKIQKRGFACLGLRAGFRFVETKNSRSALNLQPVEINRGPIGHQRIPSLSQGEPARAGSFQWRRFLQVLSDQSFDHAFLLRNLQSAWAILASNDPILGPRSITDFFRGLRRAAPFAKPSK